MFPSNTWILQRANSLELFLHNLASESMQTGKIEHISVVKLCVQQAPTAIQA